MTYPTYPPGNTAGMPPPGAQGPGAQSPVPRPDARRPEVEGPGTRRPEADSRPGPASLVGASLWRLLIAFCGLYGYLNALSTQLPSQPFLEQMSSAGEFLSQIGSLVIGLFYLGFALYPLAVLGRRLEPDSPWIRGQLVVLMLLIALPYNTIMGGSLDSTWEMLEHVVTPLLVLIDWLVVGRNQGRARWWYPFSWLSYPLVYLYAIIVYGAPNYQMFPPSSDDFFLRVVAGMTALVVIGYIVLGLGRASTAIKASVAGTG